MKKQMEISNMLDKVSIINDAIVDLKRFVAKNENLRMTKIVHIDSEELSFEFTDGVYKSRYVYEYGLARREEEFAAYTP